MQNKELSAIEAKNEAQKLAFAPIFFQAVVAMKKLGIFPLLAKNKKGLTLDEISSTTGVSIYGVKVLLEAGEAAGIISMEESGISRLTKTGYFLNSDIMTNININFVNDVCYDGAKFLNESIINGKPEGLKTLGNWKTLYEGLASFPEPARTSWFEFDHYYSDDAFPAALEIVFREKPRYIFDVGGNTGKWAFACCAYNSEVKVKILDLPGQLNVSRKNAGARNLTERIDFHEINMLDPAVEIPAGADAIWMSQFLDCFSPEEIVAILRKTRDAAGAGTFIYIMEPYIDNQKFEAAKYSLVATSLYFTTIANGNSKMYRSDEMERLVKEAALEIREIHPLIGNSYHTVFKCARK